jgi:hypothetical protein
VSLWLHPGISIEERSACQRTTSQETVKQHPSADMRPPRILETGSCDDGDVLVSLVMQAARLNPLLRALAVPKRPSLG